VQTLNKQQALDIYKTCTVRNDCEGCPYWGSIYEDTLMCIVTNISSGIQQSHTPVPSSFKSAEDYKTSYNKAIVKQRLDNI